MFCCGDNMALTSLWIVQVAQLDSVAPVAGSAGSEESTNMVDVAQLMAAVLEDSPSNRLTMLQTSGATSQTIIATLPSVSSKQPQLNSPVHT